ncbi:DUF4124 domain-containing protein [Comamonas sp.]|uniref:DUF4124 domain-containing protein n=1 Tax=Comamonas sp. TaxID=34028 RepID=UPI00289C5D88|nr:DUF4124 domain-containing protein [Comamonas sp.]
MLLHRCLLTALMGTGLCALSTAHAQVVRCTDAQGRVTYTEGACPAHQTSREVVPELSAQERAEQAAQYQRALENKRATQQAQAEREAAQAQEAAQRAAAEAARRPPPAPIVVVPPAPAAPSDLPVYGPLYPPRPPHPPHVRPPHPQPPPPPSEGYNCNVFRCYDGKGNTWQRP